MSKTLLTTVVLLLFVFTVNATTIDSLNYGAFGKVKIYKPEKTPEAMVIFVSGDGGWTTRESGMAMSIVNQGAMVLGIDIRSYLKALKIEKSKCYYPASDFENLSMSIQKKYKFSQYLKPILFGYSSGATLVYGALVQAPANTFKGAIALGFCPDLDIDKPLCQGSGLTWHVLKEGQLYYLEPAKHLTSPFIVLEGMTDQVCSYQETKKFMENMPYGELVSLPNVGHGFSVTKNSMPQILAAYQKVVKELNFSDKITQQNTSEQQQEITQLNTNLPITTLPSSTKENLPLVFFISGDGGWSGFDHGVSEKCATEGIPAIGLDSQKYFWEEKQPKATADEIAKVISYYMKKWNRKSFIMVGYSFGACVAPFIANNFSPALKENLKGVFCLSPDETGDFEIHIADMLSISTNEKYNVVKEMEAITSLNPVCIFGDGESDNLQEHFALKGIKIETLPGGHHYNNDYAAIVSIILKDYLK